MTRAASSVPLLDLVVCAACRAGLAIEPETGVLRCGGCGRAYSVAEGIPVLVADEPPEAADAKWRQAAYFDSEEAEFEISRPHGTPALYRTLLAEKFRRGTYLLQSALEDARALVVCGGSGMDAEFLARAGLSVVTSDISLGAVRRARERGRRYGFDVSTLVADAERLPFPDRSFELVYVHDGLHHLERPLDAVAEMARVASVAVSITEPARAAVTAAAVRFGLALAREEAGNEVKRLDRDEVCEMLNASGFRVLEAGRYGMYYRHRPGRVSRLLSHPGVLPLAGRTLAALNRPLGRFGNKLAVQAIRDDVGSRGPALRESCRRAAAHRE